MLPKLTLAGLAAKYPGAVAAAELIPVPERVIVVLLECCLPLLPIGFKVARYILPLTLPLAWGAKVTDKVAVRCGPRVIGKPGPAKLNPVPLTLACEIVTFDLPLLLTTMDKVLLLASLTLPKFMLEEESASCPFAAIEDRRNLRRSSFQQTCLHWGMSRLIFFHSLAPR
jgi:hypothetical protein